MYINEDECIAANLDPKEVQRIAKGLSRYAKQAQALGITIFGGSSGRLDFDDLGTGNQPLIVANLDGMFDGGCGSTTTDENGLLRGE